MIMQNKYWEKAKYVIQANSSNSCQVKKIDSVFMAILGIFSSRYEGKIFHMWFGVFSG